MELKRQSKTVYGLLAGVWLVVAGWQCQEHFRVVETAKSDLRNRSREIASTLSAVTRALRFRGAIFQERLEPVLNELVSNRTNAIVSSSGLLAVSLLNTEGNPMVTAGDTNLLAREISAERERLSDACVTFVLPLAGASAFAFDAQDSPRSLALLRRAHGEHVRVAEMVSAGAGAEAEAAMRAHAETPLAL